MQNGEEDCQDKKGYIYIIQTREFITQDKPVYKIGRTGQEIRIDDGVNKRLDQYPKGSLQIALFAVRNRILAERKVKKELKLSSDMKQCKEYGHEYFEGPIEKVCQIVQTVALEDYKQTKVDILSTISTSSNNELKCMYCQETYSRIDNLKRHIESRCREKNDIVRKLEIKLDIKVEIKKDTKCRFCNKEYTQKSSLGRHLKKCKKKQEYQTRLENI